MLPAYSLAELPTDVESLQAIVADLQRRLGNAQLALSAEKKSQIALHGQCEGYKHKLREIQHKQHIEAARINNESRKIRKREMIEKYASNKQKLTQALEELRMQELDYQMSKLKYIKPVQLTKKQKFVVQLESDQQSLLQCIQQMSALDQMHEDLVTESQLGHVDQCLYLVNSGADVNYLDSAGYLALHYACVRGHLDIVKLLIERGADYTSELSGFSAVVLAAQEGQIPVIDYLLEAGANVEDKGKAGIPATIAALQSQQFTTLQFLLEQGRADVEATDRDESTLAHFAVQLPPAHLYVLQYLLDRGINMQRLNRKQKTPLGITLFEQKKHIIDCLKFHYPEIWALTLTMVESPAEILQEDNVLTKVKGKREPNQERS